MACFFMRVEFVPSIISSLLTASGAALSIVFGLLQKKVTGAEHKMAEDIITKSHGRDYTGKLDY